MARGSGWFRLNQGVLVRVAADWLVVVVAAVFTAALEIAATAALASGGALAPGSDLGMAARWGSALAWWAPLLASVTVFVFWRLGLYGHARTHRLGYKVRTLAFGMSLVMLGWLIVLTATRNRMGVPELGTTAAILSTLVGVVSSRLSLYMLERAGVVSPAPLRAANGKIESVLVIGGAGYIGSLVCEQLLKLGYRVRVLDSLLFGAEGVAGLRRHPRFELREGDVRDLSALVAAATDMDAIVHLAAIVGDPACELDHDLTLEINLLATRSVKEVAHALGVKRLVFASSCSVYGAVAEVVDERSSTVPVSLYGRTKVRSEELLLERTGRLTTTVLRFATLYGLSRRLRFDLVVNLFVAQALKDRRLTVHGGGQWRPLLHVRDAAGAVVSVLSAPVESVAGEIFNVGSESENYRIAEIAEMIAEEVPGTLVLQSSDFADARDYRVSFRKIRDRLNFTPRITLRQGITELVQELTTSAIDYRQSQYSNVLHLSTSGRAPVARDRALMEMAESS